MRSAAKFFYLAVFGFMSQANADKHGEKSMHSYDTCAVSPVPEILHDMF
jgi:hypothetical protein